MTAPEDWNNHLSEIQRLLFVDLDSSDADVVRAALQKLGELSEDGAETGLTLPEAKKNSKAIVLASSGGALILRAMRTWWTHAGVQAEGCNAFGNASVGSKSFMSKSLQHTTVQLGGLETTLLALKNFPTSAEVQLSGCCALHNLCFRERSLTQRLFHQLDGARAFMSAMKAFPTHPKVQEYGALALENACQWDEFHQLILDADGFDVLSTAMKHHKDNVTIRKVIAEAMEHLCQALKK